MWCGVATTGAPPFCGYGSLPGYGDRWSQQLTSSVFEGSDRVRISYLIRWDSEAGYDGTVLRWRSNPSDGMSSRPTGITLGRLSGIFSA